MEKNICNNGSFKIEGKGRDEWPTSSRLCLLTRIDAHVETSITRGLDFTFLGGKILNFRSTVNQFRQPRVPSYWQFRNNFLQETETEKCQEPINWLNEQSNVGIKKMNYLFIGILKSKGGITFLLFLLPLCSQPIYTLPTPLPQKWNKNWLFDVAPRIAVFWHVVYFVDVYLKALLRTTIMGK